MIFKTGDIVHHAIVVSSFRRELIDTAREHARSLGCSVSEPIVSAINVEWSFLIGPDGSKEGWEHSDNGDAQRDAWIRWARRQRYEDHSSPLAWAEIEYSRDDRRARVVRHEWSDGVADAADAAEQNALGEQWSWLKQVVANHASGKLAYGIMAEIRDDDSLELEIRNELGSACWTVSDRHALAALCLHEQPFGFTASEADALEHYLNLPIMHHGPTFTEAQSAIAKIRRLLPPAVTATAATPHTEDTSHGQ